MQELSSVHNHPGFGSLGDRIRLETPSPETSLDGTPQFQPATCVYKGSQAGARTWNHVFQVGCLTCKVVVVKLSLGSPTFKIFKTMPSQEFRPPSWFSAQDLCCARTVGARKASSTPLSQAGHLACRKGCARSRARRPSLLLPS